MFLVIDTNTIASRLSTIEQCKKIIDRSRAKGLQHYLKDQDTRLLTERALHLAIEASFDVANHIIASRGYRRPSTYADIFKILGEEQVISDDLTERLVKMARFRHRLVHLYTTLDNEIVFSILEKEISDILEFASIVSKML